MSPIRLLTRWVLTLVALSLALAALVLVAVRLGAWGLEAAKPRIESLLSSRFAARVEIRDLDAGVAGLDPRLSLDGLVVHSRRGLGAPPLIEVEQARLRLDSLASLRDGLPVVEDARVRGVTLHLYQDDEGRWHWPAPARLPPEMVPDAAFDLDRLDFWVGLLLRQRAWVEEVRLVLHGQARRAVLEAPRLLMTGDDRRTHLEGSLHLEGEREVAMQAVLEIQPGEAGLRDFSAALQADMRLDGLTGLAEVLGHGAPLRWDAADGDARLWGRWQDGRLADVRLDLEAPLLAMSRETAAGEPRAIVIKDLVARGQWLRGETGWEAWLEGDAGTADWNAPTRLAENPGPAIPDRWHLRGDGGDWWLTTSEFELGSLAAWRNRLPLPVALDRAVATLDPRGRVVGLGLGREGDSWLARAALEDVEVDPWGKAPGGGPLDMWVEAEDLTGRVRFHGDPGSRLYFPELFAAPMQLDHADGEVTWLYDGPRSLVSGRDLRAGWRGAKVEGGFGLSAGQGARGGLGLTLDFRDVDAVDTPLIDWLPVAILGDDLRDWLDDGVTGRVPEGALRLHVPLAGGAERIPPRFGLDLAIEEGRLPMAPGWPALERVEGRLNVEDDSLEATIDRLESLGVEARDGRATLIDDRLEIEGDLVATADALRDFLMALPMEGMEAVEAWRGEGRAEGQLRLALDLDEADAPTLDIDTRVELSRLEQVDLGLVFHDLSGPLGWRQRDDQAGLEGRLEGRLLGGPLRADIDTLGGGLDLSGRATAEALVDWAGLGGSGPLRGAADWQASLSLGESGSQLRLDSGLEGLAIDLPAPLGKAAEATRALRLDVDLDQGRLAGRLGDALAWRWRELVDGETGQGQVWLGRAAPTAWPSDEGWHVDAYQPRLDLAAWGQALSGLAAGLDPGQGGEGLARLDLATGCLRHDGRCLGSLEVGARPQAGGGWRLAADGSLLAGVANYRPRQAESLDIALERLSLDALLPEPEGSGSLFDELDTPPEPDPLPDWIDRLPDGRLRVADIAYRDRVFGPFHARWHATPERLTVAPLGLTLGEVSARGELVWEAAGAGESLSRARLDLDGRDLGTALERLGQPASIRSAETRVKSQLAWPGAPWQFALARSRGSIEAALRDGRFVNLESPSARLVGLLNVDNLLRRLRLDFSDVTGQGTAFDRVSGAATLYGGILETRGPVEVEGPATLFTLDGRVDLARRELDQRLGVTVPVSRNLPLAAVLAGAPVVGGALFLADKLFGDAIDRVTRIHYRVEGPWTSPRISVESAE